jgi:hypothetical protein
LSRLRSSRASKGSASSASRSATPARQRGVLVQAPKSDIYVALLGISLAAVLIGCLLMLLLLMRYEFKVSVASVDREPAAVSLASHQVDLAPTPLSPSTA